jgi:glutamate racemase
MDDRPIGVFDSGFGGLTVARAVIDLLPEEDLVYIGDTGRYPYGPRALDEVRGFAAQITDKLVEEFGVKLVVVACNTAAAAGLEELQDRIGVPIISVIEPGLRASLRATESGRIGVIGTVGTVGSGAYQRAATALDPDVNLTCAACPGFVEFVERGETDSDQVYVLAERLLAPIREAKVDALLLGCTHYPFLARTISDVVGRDVVLVSSADETAFELRALLARDGLRRSSPGPASHTWISSGDTETFRVLGRRLMGPEIDQVQPWVPGPMPSCQMPN